MSPHSPYKNPPIIEALCAFQFEEDPNWTISIPGKLHDKISDKYPGTPRETRSVKRVIKEDGIDIFPEKIRLIIPNDDDTSLVAIEKNELSISVLNPYEGWSEFKPRIDYALEAYCGVTKVTNINRIGLRYINKIVIPNQSVDYSEYFQCGPPRVPGLPSEIKGFVDRAEYIAEDDIRIILHFAKIPDTEGGSGYLLDLDVIKMFSEPQDMSSAIQFVDKLHEIEGNAFEALIREKARALFND